METSTTAFLNQLVQNRDKIKCIQCNRIRKSSDENNKICCFCNLSGNKLVDDFIRSLNLKTYQISDMMEFVPYDKFKDIEFNIKVYSYEATWIDGCIWYWDNWNDKFIRRGPMQVVLKRLNNSDNITFEELNEVSLH